MREKVLTPNQRSWKESNLPSLAIERGLTGTTCCVDSSII